jgi:SAM-dependent methyltransferase
LPDRQRTLREAARRAHRPDVDEHYWDDKYHTRDRLWSGEPNGVLVVEAADLTPGQALDLGCGEGADARWLAARGWLVTAVDISRVALERAAAVAGGEGVSWTHGDLTVFPPPAGAFDLVSAIYFPLPRAATRALDSLLAAVAPGGTLLVATHNLDTSHREHMDPAFDPDDYYWPHQIAAALDGTWKVEVDEIRPRVSATPPAGGHIEDIVLKARKGAWAATRAGH